MAADSLRNQVEEGVCMRRYFFDNILAVLGMQSKCHMKISIISDIIEVMEKTQTIHLLLTLEFCSFEKATPNLLRNINWWFRI